MKKVLIIVGSIFLTFITLIAISIVLIIDKKDINNPNVVRDNRELLAVINNELYVDSVDVKEKEELPILFSEEELEYLVYSLFTILNEDSLIKFIGIDFDVENSEYTVIVQVEAMLVKTTAKLKVGFSRLNDAFVISFDKIALGKLGLTWIGKLIIGGMSEDEIEEKLAENGIYAKVRIKEKRIILSYDDLEKTITSNIEEENKDLISLLIDVFLRKEDLLKINFGEDDLLGATLYLKNAKYIEGLHEDLEYNYDFSEAVDKCETLLKEGIIKIDELDASFNFLVRGYFRLDDEVKDKIKDIDYSKVGIVSKELYQGIIDHSDLSLKGYIGGLFENKTLVERIALLSGGIMISDDFLNGIFQSLDFVGFSYAFNDYSNNVGYFTIEEFFIHCYDEVLKLDLVININGYRVVVEGECSAKDDASNGLVVNCKVESLEIGSVSLTKEETYKLLSYLDNVLSDLDWISTNPSEEMIYMDFSKVLAESVTSSEDTASVLSNILNKQTNVYVEEGYISIKH